MDSLVESNYVFIIVFLTSFSLNYFLYSKLPIRQSLTAPGFRTGLSIRSTDNTWFVSLEPWLQQYLHSSAMRNCTLLQGKNRGLKRYCQACTFPILSSACYCILQSEGACLNKIRLPFDLRTRAHRLQSIPKPVSQISVYMFLLACEPVFRVFPLR